MTGLANAQGADLPRSVRYQLGITTNDAGKHQRFEPPKQALSGDPPGTKIDLSNLNAEQRLIAFHSVLTHGVHRGRKTQGQNVHYKDDTAFTERFWNGIEGKKMSGRYQHRSVHDNETQNKINKLSEKELADAQKLMYDGTIPDSIYLANVKFGANDKHEVAMIVGDNTILEVDASTLKHDFQKWDDYDQVAKQLNDFAEAHNLKIDKKAVKKEKELRLHKGKFMSASGMAQERLGTMKQRGAVGLEGTDELKFDDGSTLSRMAPDDQAKWARKGLKTDTLPGEAWVLKSEEGKEQGVVIVKNNEVVAAYKKGGYSYASDTRTDMEKLSRKGLNRATVGAIRSGMEQLGWGVKDKAAPLMIKKGSRTADALLQLRRNGDNWYRIRKNSFTGDTSPWRALVNMNLARAQATDRGSTSLQINDMGKEAARRLQEPDVEHVNVISLPSGNKTPVHPEWEKPTRKEKPKRKTSTGQRPATSTARTGSKAAQALEKFEEFVADNDRIPRRGEFIETLTDAPFNMSRAGAQTYYYTTKAKYNKKQEESTDESYDWLLSQAAAINVDGRTFGTLRGLLI